MANPTELTDQDKKKAPPEKWLPTVLSAGTFIATVLRLVRESI